VKIHGESKKKDLLPCAIVRDYAITITRTFFRSVGAKIGLFTTQPGSKPESIIQVCKVECNNAAAVRAEARYYTQSSTPGNIASQAKQPVILICQRIANLFKTPPYASIRHVYTFRYFTCYVSYDTTAPRLFGLLRPGRFFAFAVWSVPSMNLSSSSILRESRPMEFRGSRPVAACAVCPTWG